MENKELIKEFQNDRVLFMEGEFNEEKCQCLSKQLLLLNSQDSKKDIILYIDSYGGDVCSYLQIYNLIESFKCNVNTIVMGKAMSAGAYLLLAGNKGKRYAYKYSQIMLHELAYSMGYSKLHDHENEFKWSKDLMQVLYDITNKCTKIKNVETYLKEDRFITAREALKLGIIDKIIE